MRAAPPNARAAKRDLFARLCMALHFCVPLFVVLGWLAPWRAVLTAYLIVLPLMAAQWRANKGSCVLNNLESWARTRRWRDPANPEEGAWLKTMAADLLGVELSFRQVSLLSHGLMLVFWCLALGHLVLGTPQFHAP